MESLLKYIILAFIMFVIIYLTINYKTFKLVDFILIAISICVLIISIFLKKRYAKETFVDNITPLNDILTQYQLIDLNENIKDISTNLVLYNTAFNKKSYTDGLQWKSLINNIIFDFDINPNFSKKNGFNLGNNRIIGPDSNLLNIDFINKFTILLVCKHGNLVTNNTNNEIELLKLYANSPNNNGIVLFIQENSLQINNNVQTGTLLFQQADSPPMPCLISTNDSSIQFEKDILTFYFIIKGNDHIRVLTMNEKNNSISELLKFNVANTDITFSNKEAVINRFKNWNSNIYNIAIYNTALTDDQITNVYNHILNEYLKYIDPNFQSMIQEYNDTITLLSNYLKCPYDKTTCDACSSINKWNDMSQLINANTTCRKAINDFCALNTNNPLCKCWNNSSPMYNTDNCKLYRSIFSGTNACLDDLTQDDLDYMRAKYGLIYPDQCPKSISKPDFLNNKYDGYNYDNIRIRLDDITTDDNTVVNLYEKEVPTTQEDDLVWDKLRIKFGNQVEPSAEEDLPRVKNYFKDEMPPTKVPLPLNPTSNKEPTKVLDDDLNIKNYYLNSTPNQESITQPTDTFFNKFMKIIF